MTDYITEQEQVEQLKKWLKQYGLTIVIGVLLAVGGTSLWNYWQKTHTRMLMHASMVYDTMLNARAQNNVDGANTQAQKLIKEYPKSPYAQMAALMQARDAVIKKNYDQAIQQLQWARDHSSTKAMRDIALLRMARIYLAQNKPDTALATLKDIKDGNFKGLADEVRGDIYLNMNNKAAAKEAYRSALQELPNAEVNRPILQMKYDNLA